MNLLRDRWIGVISERGERGRRSPCDIGARELRDLVAPRPDFRGGLYQFLIGLLQTGFAPKDLDEWLERWHRPPTAAELEKALASLVPAFEFDAEGPAFMQDYAMPDGETKPVAALLIDAPGVQTQKNNLDHFIKSGQVDHLCPACAATALFTLQINAPAGGQGHRVSLRGGGPMTTLVLPADPDATLWHKLWSNILPGTKMPERLASALPWMAPTRLSDGKGVETTPETVHPLQAYWSMPRRIRLEHARVGSRACDICGEETETGVSEFRTRNYGTNYAGAWTHPLTPYVHDPSQGGLPISIKGQKGGIAYRQWVGLVLGRDEQPKAAEVVEGYPDKWSRLCVDRKARRRQSGRLWCFGYDMDNMKARCWYDALLPFYALDGATALEFGKATGDLLDVAIETAKLLDKQVKAARFRRPGDVGPEPAVSQSFWQETESFFYEALGALAQAEALDARTTATVYREWIQKLRGKTQALFDRWVLDAPIEEMDAHRVMEARIRLRKFLWTAKPMRSMDQLVNELLKEAA